jgi:hypothetical protein
MNLLLGQKELSFLDHRSHQGEGKKSPEAHHAEL